ncbi:micronuclear linker histone polyprotein [Magallana gigas]|uniref:micronuclear linker histone polyprotein n=1 Tax=Magallana gigas TaxID=29159 RepID=UPI0033401C70
MLSPKTLKKLPKTVHSPKDWSYLEMKEIDSLLRCPICYDFMHTAMILPECSHTFCSFCIRQHLSHTNQCPACNHGACENNLRNNRLVDDLIVQFKAIRSLLLEITQKHSNEKDSDLNQSNETVLQESKTQKKLPNSKTITSIPTTVKDDVIDLISEDGEGKEEDESEDWKLRENKENQGISTPGKSLPDRDGGGELSTPRNQRSSLQSMFSPSPKQMVSCPVCGLSLREGAMNDHLDLCLWGEEKKSALRKPTPKRKPMAKLVYNLMSERDIKKKLKEVGLSTAGDKKTLVRRHHDFVMLYNSECDALKPKSVQEIVKEVEKTENIRNRSRTDHSRLLIEKNSSPATIEKAQKIYMKKHKSHFSDLIAETKKRMREQRMKQKKSSDGNPGPESETENSVTEASDTGTVGTQSESEGEGRRMSSRNRKRVGMGQCDEEEMLSRNQDIIKMSSQSETESGTQRKSSQMKWKVIREEDMETENSGGDGSELEVVLVQSETESERRMSVRHQGKNMSDQGKTGRSCVEDESESRMKKSRNSKGAKKEVAEVDEDSDPVSQIETDGKSRRRSVRNQSKIESSKATENESTEDTEQNNQRRTRNRKTSVSAMTKSTNEAKKLSGQERKQDRNMGNELKENRHQNHTPKRSTQNKKSDPNSSRGKKAYTEIDTGDSSEEKVTEMEVESDFQEQDEGSAEKNKPDLLDMVDRADISSTLPGKNGHSKSKSYKNEGTFKRKKNLKRRENIDIEDEMVDKQNGINEEDEEVELEPSTWLEDKEKETMKDDKLMESSNGGKQIFIKDQSDKSVGIVADGSGYASLQTTPKSKSKTSDEQNESGKSDNPEKDDSLHIDETPVKEYDVDNISTLWPALSGAVDVSTARTRHLSSISTKSDKSNCSDLPMIFSPIKDLKNLEGDDKKTERVPVKREISGDFENRKRKRLSEPASRKRRRR